MRGTEALAHMVTHLAGRHVLVIGDVTLDEYVYGTPTRLSREAPIPVLELSRRDFILGGAANPSRNIVALGSHAIQIGVVGNDYAGEQLRAACLRDNISPNGLITVATKPTTTKTRIMAEEQPRLPQQVARIDLVDRTPLGHAAEAQLIDAIAQHIPHVQAVLCSDYQLGLLTPTVIDTIRQLCQQHHVLLTVDTQGNAEYYRAFDMFRCNNVEASKALGGKPLTTEQAFCDGLHHLQHTLQVRFVIVTRGPDGVSFLDEHGTYHHIAAVDTSEVYDTTGAGDTFIAVATLALAAGCDAWHTVQLANNAAALVVRKFGNAVVTPQELHTVLKHNEEQ